MLRIAFLLLIALAACSNPRDTPFPKEISKMDSIKPALEKLTPEERELVADYVMRHTVGAAFGSAFGVKADPIPDEMTIGKAIEEQRSFVEKQRAEETAKKARTQGAGGSDGPGRVCAVGGH